MNTTEKLIILSGPSGAGKTTLMKYLLSHIPHLSCAITHTTRAPRPGESDGVDYFFVSKEHFANMQRDNLFIETNWYNQQWYGVSKQTLRAEQPHAVKLVIPDINGARIIADHMPHAFAVWITAPHKDLEERLRKRGESEENIAQRIARAQEEDAEAAESGIYHKTLVNTDLAAAQRELLGCVRNYLTTPHR